MLKAERACSRSLFGGLSCRQIGVRRIVIRRIVVRRIVGEPFLSQYDGNYYFPFGLHSMCNHMGNNNFLSNGIVESCNYDLFLPF